MTRITGRQTYALWGILGSGILLATICLLSWAIPVFRQHPELLRRLQAWKMGARFVSTHGVVRQQRANDCGPAALKMILAHHGIERSLSELTTSLAPHPGGTSLRQLRLAATRLGLPAKSWHIRPQDLPHVPLPVIAFVHKRHFVVLRRFVTPEVLEVDDPAIGKLQWPARSFQKAWSGETLVFDPIWTPPGCSGGGQFFHVSKISIVQGKEFGNAFTQ